MLFSIISSAPLFCFFYFTASSVWGNANPVADMYFSIPISAIPSSSLDIDRETQISPQPWPCPLNLSSVPVSPESLCQSLLSGWPFQSGSGFSTCWWTITCEFCDNIGWQPPPLRSRCTLVHCTPFTLTIVYLIPLAIASATRGTKWVQDLSPLDCLPLLSIYSKSFSPP